MNSTTRALAVSAAILLPISGIAAQTVNSIDATFANSLPVGSASINNSDAANIQVCWPDETSADCSTLGSPGLSGYGFARSSFPFATGFSPFQLGTFTHYNFVIDPLPPGSLTSVDLLFSFSIGGATPSDFSDSWTLSHHETPNSGVCPYPGGAKCADRVSFALTSGGAPTAFTIGTTLYQITILGFGESADEAVQEPEFITFENQANSTILWAQITEVPTGTVPEPATMTLLATGLAGLAAARRKRRNNA